MKHNIHSFRKYAGKRRKSGKLIPMLKRAVCNFNLQVYRFCAVDDNYFSEQVHDTSTIIHIHTIRQSVPSLPPSDLIRVNLHATSLIRFKFSSELQVGINIMSKAVTRILSRYSVPVASSFEYRNGNSATRTTLSFAPHCLKVSWG